MILASRFLIFAYHCFYELTQHENNHENLQKNIGLSTDHGKDNNKKGVKCRIIVVYNDIYVIKHD